MRRASPSGRVASTGSSGPPSSRASRRAPAGSRGDRRRAGRSGTAIPVAAGEKPLAVASAEPALVAIVPTWRRDLHIEADIAEEMARVRGYDAVPTKTPDTAMPHFRPDPLEVRDALRRALAGAGLTEVVTPALVPDGPGRAPVAGPSTRRMACPAPMPWPGSSSAPATRSRSAMRSFGRAWSGASSTCWPSTNVTATATPRSSRSARATPAASDGSPAEWWRLGFLLAGDAIAPTWSLPGRSWDVEDAKAIAALAAGVIGAGVPVFRAHVAGEPLHPGRAASVDAPGSFTGWSGSCTRPRLRRGTCARSVSSSASSRSPVSMPAAAAPCGSGRRAARWHRARHRARRGRGRPRRGGGSDAPRGRRRCAAVPGPVRCLPRGPAGRDGEEPRLAAHHPGR